MLITTISLDIPLHPGHLPAFRACIAELDELVHPELHNHRPDREDTDRNWGYPLFQYAVRRGKATIIAIGEASDAIAAQLWPKLKGTLHFAGQEHLLSRKYLSSTEFELQLLPVPRHFALRGWLALNAEGYSAWKADQQSEDARRAVLSRALTGHLRSMSETLGLPEYKSVEARVLQVDGQKKIKWHGVDLIRFDVQAEANILPPPGIGIGRAAAFGFGEVCHI